MAVGRISRETAALTGLSYQTMYGNFSWTSKSGRSNEVAVIKRCPY